MNRSKLTFTVLFFCYASIAFAQSGLQFYGGISNASNNDMAITPEGQSHPGYHFGADARLVDGNMYFILGGQFHKVEFLSQTEKDYFSVEDNFNWMKLRVGLGYQFVRFTDKIILRGKSLISFNFMSKVPDSVTDAPYLNYNSGTVGGVLGIGMDIYNFTIDAEYEKGFFKAVNMVSGTEFNFITFSLGYKI